MLVSLNPGGIAGGSGTQYFVGDFDGTTFTARWSGHLRAARRDRPPGLRGRVCRVVTDRDRLRLRARRGDLPRAADGHRLRGLAPRQQLHRWRQRAGRTHLTLVHHRSALPELPRRRRSPRGHSRCDTRGSGWHVLCRLREPRSRQRIYPPGWKATGDFVGFGATPSGLPNHQGANVLDTCVVPDKCDSAVGTFESPEFTVTQRFVNLLIAGGTHPLSASAPTVVELVVDGVSRRLGHRQQLREMDWRYIDASLGRRQDGAVRRA